VPATSSESPSFPHLAAPLDLGPFELKNRLVQTGHATAMAKDGLPQEQLRAYYRERARGGVAMIITEAQTVHPTASIGGRTVNLYDDRIVDAYRAIVEQLHPLGTRFVAQLWHSGNNVDSSVIERAAWAPSPVAGPLNHEIPHQVTEREIEELIDAYGAAAERAIRGGVDGVEVHLGHGYLPQQFLSPLTNQRTDRYGGSWENRLRFPFAVVDRIREAIGSAALGIRLSAEEGQPGGFELPETLDLVERLLARVEVSYLSVSHGTYGNMEIQTAPMGTPAGHLVHLAAAVKERVAVPVLAVGRILTPQLAERVLAEGKADLIGMARELIADPRYPTKALNRAAAEIRPCVGCNYCQSRLWTGAHLTCIHNPAAGREAELGEETLKKASTPRRVIVVGGGPAGLEAATVAALRGHEVELYERSSRLGGQIRFAARPQSRTELWKVVSHREMLLEKLDVTVHLDAEVSVSTLTDTAADAIVLATGSTPRTGGANCFRPDLRGVPGIETARTLTSWDVLSHDPPRIGSRVLVLDFQGQVQALAVADHLLDLGAEVEFVTPLPHAGLHITGVTWPRMMQLVCGKGARLHPNLMPAAVDGDRIELANVFGGPVSTLTAIDAIVVIGDAVSNDELVAELEAIPASREIFTVGDCVAPRQLDMAILEGHRAGRHV
jgi:2,4-dienoyl-CoA reductase-like NADH-dependent reductase (Old Yellow Enzyme family)